MADLRGRGYRAPWELTSTKRLMIGTEGVTDSGKTEFMLSAPPPIGIICIDRNHEPTFRNPKPPAARANIQKEVLVKVINVPMQMAAQQAMFVEYWQNYRDECYALSSVQGLVTMGLDGDSDSWELQRLAAFGKLKGVPSLSYDEVNAARRAMIGKIHDAGKNVIATNKVRDEYTAKLDPDTGEEIKGDSGKVIKEKSGELIRRGFPDQDYLWHVQLRHLVKKGGTKVIEFGPMKGKTVAKAPEFGIKILKCKPRMELEQAELWGSKCNFKGLVKFIFPDDSMKVWGYPTEE